MSQARVGVAVLVWCEGKILIGRRKGSHGAGTWSLPGGKLESAELAVARASLELLEETGIDVLPANLTPREWAHSIWDDQQKGPQNWVTLFFETEIDDPSLPEVREPEKCETWIWVNPLSLHNFVGELFPPLANFINTFPPHQWPNYRLSVGYST